MARTPKYLRKELKPMLMLGIPKKVLLSGKRYAASYFITRKIRGFSNSSIYIDDLERKDNASV